MDIFYSKIDRLQEPWYPSFKCLQRGLLDSPGSVEECVPPVCVAADTTLLHSHAER